METLSGVKLMDSFDPQLIAGFDEIWDETLHHKWEPIYKKDLRLQQNYDFFRTIVHRVKKSACLKLFVFALGNQRRVLV